MTSETSLVGRLAPFPAAYLAYNEKLVHQLERLHGLASRARSVGLDPTPRVESEIAYDLAERVDRLLNISVAARLRELFLAERTEKVALLLAEEIALGKFGFLSREEALDRGIRAGLAVVTDGITVAPLQGVSSVSIKKNEDGSPYVSIAFAGPIRSAGGTEAAFTLVLADHLRRTLGLEKYRPNAWGDDEVGRMVEELRIYERDVSNFQFRVSNDDVRYALLHLPVEVDGVETDPVEVVVHRGLRRVETDRVRGGALRVLNDGVIGRSRKLRKLLVDLGVPGWDWLAELGSARQQSSDETRVTHSHFEEVISGRPVLSFPGRVGGFRLRYGRAPNTGLSTVGVHPAAAALLDYAFVPGTQVKLDLPGKAATIAFVDSLETPIVRLADGSIVRLEGVYHAQRLRDRITRILHLGDVLVSFGDFLENNVALVPSAYVEEWWVQDVAQAIRTKFKTAARAADASGLGRDRLRIFGDFTKVPTATEAVALSRALGVPLHPRYVFFWDNASPTEVLALRQALQVESDELGYWLVSAPGTPEIKTTVEKIGIPHRVHGDGLLMEGEAAYVVLSTLGLPARQSVLGDWRDLPQLLSTLAGFPVRRKTSVFVGIRIGRPEKAMLRHMKPPVHLLFPVGIGGGPSRDLLHASQAGDVNIELLNRICATCGAVSLTTSCDLCGGQTAIQKLCPSCGRPLEGGLCPACRTEGVPYGRVRFPLKQTLQVAVRRVNYQPAAPLKGVQRLTNATRVAEALAKGILRAKHDLTIYKDGTVRFDATNVPLTHFRPHQIGTTVEKLRELGYQSDATGRALQADDQLVELFTQDIVLPWEAGLHFVSVARFVDDLLVQVYGLEPYYNLRSPHDLVGHLVAGLAPHTSVGVVGRVIGFTTGQVCFAHPYWHSAKRRDCDGDQDSLMLILDLFLNFSREFLPAQIGGLMDAPLLLQPIVLPHEVQRQAHNLDVARQYSAAFYEATQRREGPAAWAERMDIVRHRLGSEREFVGLGFTHPSTTLSAPRPRSSYATVKSLPEKLQKQIDLARKIAAVDAHEVVAAVLRTHLLPDVLGNLRAYTAQRFRCKECGTRYRRPPLKGECLSCGGALQPTVTRASIEKYLELGRRLCTEFEVGEYLRRRFDLAAQELALLFPPQETARQQSLGEFLGAP